MYVHTCSCIALVSLGSFIIALPWQSQQRHPLCCGVPQFSEVPRITSLSTLRTTAVRSSHFQHKYTALPYFWLMNFASLVTLSINYLKFKPAIKSIQALPVFIIQFLNAFPSLSFFLSSLSVLSTLEMDCNGLCIQDNYFPKFMSKLPFFTILRKMLGVVNAKVTAGRTFEQFLCPS